MTHYSKVVPEKYVFYTHKGINYIFVNCSIVILEYTFKIMEPFLVTPGCLNMIRIYFSCLLKKGFGLAASLVINSKFYLSLLIGSCFMSLAIN
jgi:hypothetical protein